ncbi:unnamed protein product [Jaminaea pallidilutea]
MSSWWGSDPFVDLVNKATSELLPAGQEDIALNLEICDQVRAKQVQPKQAMQAIKRRIGDNNPNVVLLALGLTDICIKNGGDHFLEQVASREFMDNLVSVLKKPSIVNYDVRTKSLRLIQNWAQISEAKPQMNYINEIYRELKSDGFDFPARDAAASSSAFVETLTAPEWIDGDVCMRCRTAFTTFNRKHHCRNCGNVFCQQCSSHNMSLPWYGVGQDVRVCDGCFSKKAPPKVPASAGSGKLQRSSTQTFAPSGRGGAGAAQRSATLDAKSSSSGRRSKREEDDLALAIKLSLQESGGNAGASTSAAPSEPSAPRATRQANGRMLEGTDADDDPDLAAAIAASLRDYAPPQPSAPMGLHEEMPTSPSVAQAPAGPPQSREPDLPLPPNLDLPPKDVDSLLTFAQTVHLQDHQARQYGSSAGPDRQAQALYDRATAARPKMARSLDEAGRRHGVLMSMHDKLTEAVRLYDRLLDAQMAAPRSNYGYAPPGQYDPRAGSPDPFPRQRYASQPQYPQQPYQQQQGRTASYGGPPDAGHQQATMYPSLPQQQTGAPMTAASTEQPQAYPLSPSAQSGAPYQSFYPQQPERPHGGPVQQSQPYDASQQQMYAGHPNTPYQQAVPTSPSVQYGYRQGSGQWSDGMPPHQQQQQQHHHHHQQQQQQQYPGYAAPATPLRSTSNGTNEAALSSPHQQQQQQPSQSQVSLQQFEKVMSSPQQQLNGTAPPPAQPQGAQYQHHPSGPPGSQHSAPTAPNGLQPPNLVGPGADGQVPTKATPMYPATGTEAAPSFPAVPDGPLAMTGGPGQPQRQQQQTDAPALIEL